MKKHIMITLDYDLWTEARTRYGNISGILNDLLRATIQTEAPKEAKTKDELETELKKQQAKVALFQRELDKLTKTKKKMPTLIIGD